jgi:hypothetical protein
LEVERIHKSFEELCSVISQSTENELKQKGIHTLQVLKQMDLQLAPLKKVELSNGQIIGIRELSWASFDVGGHTWYLKLKEILILVLPIF